MRSDDFGFRNNDVSSLDRIIDAISELEVERKSMHQKLETETIKASILRHDLKMLPGIIRDEIMVAVNAARQSNADALKDLQEQLDKMNNNMTELEVRARELERENAILHPERELLKQQHEEIISQLNQKMADKATMQIALNETRDKVRQANQDIVDLEDGILQLKEDLIQERTEARHEKKRLKKAVIDTKTKTKEQKEQNVEKKKELDTNQERLMDSEGRLDSIRKELQVVVGVTYPSDVATERSSEGDEILLRLSGVDFSSSSAADFASARQKVSAAGMILSSSSLLLLPSALRQPHRFLAI
ncbi:myosin-2 heavy chain-like [Elysia marginata]|uniref:Myosin-2 heavy chain-like n=1 Tax=Elysia marginata TaxID=1093978 RepID=A0AAV4EEC4_9GAST|nr:myosin-2 heavy chain-like [Elysia marginata]